MNWLAPYLAGKRKVIWDWNGTLLDDVDHSVETIGRVLDEHGLPELGREEYLRRFGFPVIDYYRSLGFDFERTPFEQVGDRFIAIYKEELLRRSRLFDGVPETLASVREAGLSQSILSAAHEGPLREQVAHFGIGGLLDRVFGLGDHYAASKVERGRALLKEAGIPASEALLVGDTEHDFEVARALGTSVLLVADGHQTVERLRKTGAPVLESRYC